MHIATKGRYVTRAMLDLAVCYGKGPILLRGLAKGQQISERYLGKYEKSHDRLFAIAIGAVTYQIGIQDHRLC